MNSERHAHLKPKICVSGAAETEHCGESVLEKTKELGREIVRQGAILVTGATTGLPLEYLDLIIYTGFGYSGRNLLLTRSSDAVLIGCGRIGTINEFTIAFEDGKPVGILEGEWETDEVIKTIIEKGHRGNPKVVYDSNPKKLVEKVLELVKKDKLEGYRVYKNPDHGGEGRKRVM